MIRHATGNNTVDEGMAELEALSTSELRNRWLEDFGNQVPARASRNLLLRALAYRLQERIEGRLSKAALKNLLRLARNGDVGLKASAPPIAHLKPGTRLVREWRGEVHHVTMLENGFEYRGEKYKSLSRIAFHITGTRWSGPLFFGLRKPRASGHGA